MRHIHLNPLGGVAGDMFVAALSHAFPEHATAAVRAAGTLAGVTCRIVPHTDDVLAGQRFRVEQVHAHDAHDHPHDRHGLDHHHHGDHEHHPGHDDDGHDADSHGRAHTHLTHTRWSQIRRRIEQAELPADVRRHAVGIFGCLADAEARVHGVDPNDVAFHEVGAADSIADIVAAAWMIAAIGPATWSTAPLPTGSGTVRTAHGVMPLPAPATALLLEGFELHDDGIPGERVTPTGAAILRYLNAAAPCPAGTLRASGFGFGSRRLPNLSNCLRVLVFDTARAASEPNHRELAVISFEIDDQSGEDLAAGLDRIRLADGVHDVVQIPAIGKKGRMAVHVQVLTRPDTLDATAAACFRETTTIGLRTQIVQGRALARRFADVTVAEHDLRVKLVERPGDVAGRGSVADETVTGPSYVTAKAEADHVLHLETHAARTRLRRAAEQRAEPA
jgi:uncharacterized protein (TIGR00299 family) protein